MTNRQKINIESIDESVYFPQQSRAIQIFEKELIRDLSYRKQKIEIDLSEYEQAVGEAGKLISKQIHNKINKLKVFWLNQIQQLFTKLQNRIQAELSQKIENIKNCDTALILKQKQKLQQMLKILEYETTLYQSIDIESKSKQNQLHLIKQKKKEILGQCLNGQINVQKENKIFELKQNSMLKLQKINWEFNEVPLKKIFELANEFYFDSNTRQLSQKRQRKQEDLNEINFSELKQKNQVQQVDQQKKNRNQTVQSYQSKAFESIQEFKNQMKGKKQKKRIMRYIQQKQRPFQNQFKNLLQLKKKKNQLLKDLKPI